MALPQLECAQAWHRPEHIGNTNYRGNTLWDGTLSKNKHCLILAGSVVLPSVFSILDDLKIKHKTKHAFLFAIYVNLECLILRLIFKSSKMLKTLSKTTLFTKIKRRLLFIIVPAQYQGQPEFLNGKGLFNGFHQHPHTG